MVTHTPKVRSSNLRKQHQPLRNNRGAQPHHSLVRQHILEIFSCLAVLIALNVILYWQHWRGATFFPFDFSLSYYASTAYWMASVQAGEWPHWIPYQGMGYPAALNPQLGLFYPPFWLVVLLRIPYTLHTAVVVQVLHVLFGSIGFFFLSRRVFGGNLVALFGGLSFALFGGFFTNSEHPDIIRGFAWTPWVFWSLLASDRTGAITVAGRQIKTRLFRTALLVPFVVACFICGAYPGHIVSVLTMAGLFIIAQHAGLAKDDVRIRVRDVLVQFAAIGLGIAMAAVLLLPTAEIRAELQRAHAWPSVARHYVQGSHVWHFIFPSNLIALASDEYSMMGMQLPIVVLLFVPFAWPRLRRLAPFLVCAAGAAVMSLNFMRPVSTALIGVVPALGLSRFPNGDYRIFFYFAVLLAGVAGFAEALQGTFCQFWRRTVLMLAVLCAIEFGAMRLVGGMTPQNAPAFLHVMYVMTACAVIAMGAYGGYIRFARWKPLFISIVLMCVMVSGRSVALAMRTSWSEPRAEIAYYDSGGIHIMQNGRLSASTIFARNEAARPQRVEVATPFDYAWRGYIDGTYMKSDYGPKSVAQQAVEANPGLSDVMRRGTQLFVIPCATVACDSNEIDSVALDTPALDAKSDVYSRNYILYRIPVHSQSLIVENEMFAPGWIGVCETHSEHLIPHRVDGALRGWVLGPGTHRVRVEYRAPLLKTGAVVSSAAFLLWTVIVVSLFGCWRTI